MTDTKRIDKLERILKNKIWTGVCASVWDPEMVEISPTDAGDMDEVGLIIRASLRDLIDALPEEK